MTETDTKRRRSWLPLCVFALALLGLSFAREPIYYVGQSDAPAYLAVARSEPAHLAYDGLPYVLHPPAYPCALRAASWLAGGDLVRGGVLLGTLAAAGLVLVTFALGRALGLGTLASLGGAAVLGTSHALAYVAQGIYREPWQALVLHAIALLLVAPEPPGARARLRTAGALALAALAAWTWDPIGVSAPLFAVAGLLARRARRGLAVAGVILACWLAWAGWRVERLAKGPSYPAGIDGMVEDTRRIPPAAFMNPNFLPETKLHNATFWPRHPTPEHLVAILGPEVLAPSSIYVDFAWDELPRELRAASCALLGLALAGAVSLASGLRTGEGRETARRFAALALPLGFLGSPGLLGNTGRYATTLLPTVALLAGAGAVALGRVFVRGTWDEGRERKATALVVGAWALVAGATIARGPHLSLARPAVHEGRAVAQVVERLAPGARIAAYVDWPSDLLWLLPRSRVLALPLTADHLDGWLEEHGTEILVVPLEVRRAGDPRANPADATHALGLETLAAIASRTQGPRPSLVPLGVAFEAEVADAPRLHAYEVIARPLPGRPAPAPFGFSLATGEGDALRRAVLAGRASPLELSFLRAHADALRAAGEPDLAALLERVR